MPELHAPEGEPVIPAFPITDGINTFVSCVSFKSSFYAVVKDIPLDIDAIGDAVKKEYVDLPAELIDEYILAIVHACINLPVDTGVQIFITYDIAKLKLVNEDRFIILWESQPLQEK